MEPYNDAAVAKIEERVDDHRRRLNTAEKRLNEQDKRLDSIADLTACGWRLAATATACTTASNG